MFETESTSLKELSSEEQQNLMSGGTYIIFANPKGGVTIWINCDEDMQITISRQDFINLMPNLFIGMNHSKILELITRGTYLFTDRKSVKTLRPKIDLDMMFKMPTIDDAMQTKKEVTYTSFGFPF